VPPEGETKASLSKKEKFARFQEVMDIFVSRMVEGNHFHGGQGPDAVDFRVYSWIQRYIHTFTMKKLLFARGSKEDKLLVWYDRMDRLSKNKTTI
jgi:hypothetical protein